MAVTPFKKADGHESCVFKLYDPLCLLCLLQAGALRQKRHVYVYRLAITAQRVWDARSPGPAYGNRRTKTVKLGALPASAARRVCGGIAAACKPCPDVQDNTYWWPRLNANHANHPASGQRCSVCVCGCIDCNDVNLLLVRHVSAYKKPSTGTRDIHQRAYEPHIVHDHIGGAHLWQ